MPIRAEYINATAVKHELRWDNLLVLLPATIPRTGSRSDMRSRRGEVESV